MNPHCDPHTGHCITCSDEALGGWVVNLHNNGLAGVEIGEEVYEVSVELLESVAVGDRVLVHAGVAIARLG